MKVEKHVWIFRQKMQVEEALGPVNKWFCGQMYGRRIDDPETLMEYFARYGAEDFARRFLEAIGDDNRLYCSQHYGRDVRDVKVLWEYYMSHRKADVWEEGGGDAMACT